MTTIQLLTAGPHYALVEGHANRIALLTPERLRWMREGGAA